MADATIRVRQQEDGDRLVDNESLSVAAQTVYRQRVRLAGAAAGDLAEVNARTDGVVALEVADDFGSFEADHRTLVASTDTTVTFTQAVRFVQVQNWDTANRVLVKDGAIATNTDAAAARVGFAPAASVPGKASFPFKTSTIHVRSAAASEITVVGFF